MTDTGDRPPPTRPILRRKPGWLETVACWGLWLVFTAVTLVAAFAAIFPLGFSGAFPEQSGEAGGLFAWALLTVIACAITPIAMGIGHWRHWHIWYWPLLCAAVLARTLFLLYTL